MSQDHPYIPATRPASKEEAVMLYGPFVGHWANHYMANSPDGLRNLDDLVQDGWLGVLAAWDDYDPARGMTFRTYATYKIRWAIFNGAREMDRNTARLYAQKVRGTDKPEYYALFNPVRLDDPRYDAMQVAEEGSSAHEQTAADESFRVMLSFIRKPRIRWVLDQYYRACRTLNDIGIDLGVSRERARQLLVQGHDVIRTKLERQRK